jgi:hypothetical protein
VPLTDRSDTDNDAYVNAIAEAMLAPKDVAPDAWRHAGTVAANHVIDHHPAEVADELAEADEEWNLPGRMGPCWLALLAGYRDTLHEYTDRGKD